MHPLVNIALTAARDSAAALAHKSERLDRVAVVDSNPSTFTTSSDIESDETLRYHIQKAHPNHSIHSRISGIHEGEAGEPVWLIDPLVGSYNYSSGYSRFGVSIAIRRGDVIEHAIVVCPMQTDEFVASRGKGAQLNSRRIRVGGEELAGCLLGLDPTNIDTQKFVDFQAALMGEGAIPRIGGHGALDVIDVACSKLHGGWCQRLSEPSLVAANHILAEAGGLSGTENGNPNLDSGKEQIFGAPKIFKHLVRMRMRLNP